MLFYNNLMKKYELEKSRREFEEEKISSNQYN